VERCEVLLHLIDGTAEDVVLDYETIIDELEQYDGNLVNKPRITALNKIDALDEVEQAEKHNALEVAVGGKVHQLSGVARDGLTTCLRDIRSAIDSSNTPELATEGNGWCP
jgi:GTP-binding protein